MKYKRDHFPLLISLFFTALSLISKYPFTGAEDVFNARQNFISGDRLDFWGSFSPWFFSLDKSEHWTTSYAIIFALMIFFGSFEFLKHNPQIFSKPLLFLMYLFLLYSSLFFSLSFSRDGALLSFFWLFFGVWIAAQKAKTGPKNILIALSVLALCTGLSFRPWLSASAIFIVIAANSFYPIFDWQYRRPFFILTLAIVIMAPLLLDLTFHRYLSFTSSYPQQQVMIMDSASISCLSPTRSQSDQALGILNELATEKPLTRSVLCGQYYPQNWGSVVFYGAQDGANHAIQLIGPSDGNIYKNFESNWIQLIKSNLPEYIQMKISLGSQFLLAGESSNLRINNFSNLLELPYVIAKNARLYSALPMLLLLLIYSWRVKKYRNQSANVIIQSTLFYFFFLAISVVAFIGDNQRYILFASVVVLFLTIHQSLKWAYDDSQ